MGNRRSFDVGTARSCAEVGGEAATGVSTDEGSSSDLMAVDEEVRTDDDVFDLLFYYTGGRVREAMSTVTDDDAEKNLKTSSLQ